MGRFTMLDFRNESVTIAVDEREGAMVIQFAGTIDHPRPGEFLDPVLEQIHLHVLKAGFRVLDADITGLGFVNSRGIKCLIKWIMRQTEVPEEQKYQIRCLYSSRVAWQQTGLKALTHLAPRTVVAVPL